MKRALPLKISIGVWEQQLSENRSCKNSNVILRRRETQTVLGSQTSYSRSDLKGLGHAILGNFNTDQMVIFTDQYSSTSWFCCIFIRALACEQAQVVAQARRNREREIEQRSRETKVRRLVTRLTETKVSWLFTRLLPTGSLCFLPLAHVTHR